MDGVPYRVFLHPWYSFLLQRRRAPRDGPQDVEGMVVGGAIVDYDGFFKGGIAKDREQSFDDHFPVVAAQLAEAGCRRLPGWVVGKVAQRRLFTAAGIFNSGKETRFFTTRWRQR